MLKLFFRDQFPLILINLIQLSLILIVIWVGGFRELSILLYAMFLGAFLLTIYLLFIYLTHRAFYRRLANPIARLDEVFETLDSASISAALSDLLKQQHCLYMNELELQKKKKSEHVTFINQWVHQMKTPLSVIELIIQDYDDEQMMSIREETDKLDKGLEMVLYAARLEVFEQDFHIHPVSLKQIIDEVISENKRLFIKKHVYPEVNISKTTVESDEKWLAFIITQIITNAVKYSTGKSEKIYIYEEKDAKETALLIQDNGVGIPKSDLKRVFDTFFTGENGRVYRESTGMGLSLVREVCEKLGHEVKIESTQGKGTLVRVSFFL